MANYQYCVATNWGKSFVSEDDSRKILPKEYAGNVWRVIANNKDANIWIAGVDGTRKTLSEAQAIVDAEINAQQTSWDNDNIEGETPEDKNIRLGERPTTITLEE